jgi:type II secretory pathway pseudopilin PulG
MALRTKSRRHNERGYVLLVLLLFLALLSIGSLAVVRNLEFRIKRDREEEMVHRGVQYSRAIKHYYKKFGRYPTRIEELENSNNLRFLRKRYKDPLNRDKATGKEKDFKFLHLTDVQMSFNAAQRGMTAVSDLANQQAGAPGALNPAAAAPTGAGPGGIGGTQNQQAQQAQGQEGADQNDTSNPDQQVSGQSGTPPPPQPLSQQAGPNGAPQVFGGGAIVGVASFNKDKTIREFNKKNHYNQWQFMYDPSTDRGGLLMTPNQPPLQGAGQNMQQQNGQPGTPNQNQNSFGSSFGNGMNPTPQPPTSEPTNQQ